MNINTFYIDSGVSFKFNPIPNAPEKIAILWSSKTASAAELFILNCLQSDKVITFSDSNTLGAGDKLDAISHIVENTPNWSVTIPISIRNKNIYNKEIDFVGIAPKKLLKKNSNNYNEILRFYKQKK